MEVNVKVKEAKPNKNNIKKNPEKTQKRVQNENFSLKKRQPSKPYQRENDIYITNKSNFKAQLNKCTKLLNTEVGEVYLHSLGNAISRSINLALQLERESLGAFGVEVNTSTITLVDDFHPLRDEDDFTQQKRMNSCVHIKVYRHSKIATATSSIDNSQTSS